MSYSRPRPRVATPLWVRAAVVVVLVGGPGWLLLGFQDRLGNQGRLAAVASEIAGRPVQVRCPGVIGRVFSWDIVEGSVRFDANGRPADDTRMRATSCAELDALAEGRRQDVLRCVAGPPAAAGCDPAAANRLAMAVDTITHEAFHLSGLMDEGQTECRSLQTMARTAQRLGVAPDQAQALAVHQYRNGYPLMPARYRAPDCVPDGPLDLRPDDPRWP
jgi:hypothetical protein